MSLTDESTAIKSLISTVTLYPALDLAEEQTTELPPTYTGVYLSRRAGGVVRGGTSSTDLRRLQTRATASSLKNARLIEDRLFAAFEHATHDVAGSPVHFTFDGADAEFEYDKTTARFYRLTDWIYGI